MAKYYERLTAEAESDIRAVLAEAETIVNVDFSSQVFQAVKAAVLEYSSTLDRLNSEAKDTEVVKARAEARKAAEAVIAEAETVKVKAEAEAVKVCKAAVKAAEMAEAEAVKDSASLTVPKLMSRIAVLAEEKAEAVKAAEAVKETTIAEAVKVYESSIAEAESTIAELDRLTTEAETLAAESAVKVLQSGLQSASGASGNSETGATLGKVLKSDFWLCGKHRDGKSDLMTGHKYTGYFLYRSSDRAVWFLPRGSAFTGASLGAYTDCKSAESNWHFVGYMVDTKSTRSLTGIVRWCRDFIYLADLDSDLSTHCQRLNDRALTDSLYKNAGGSVFMTKTAESDYTLPEAEAPEAETAEAESD